MLSLGQEKELFLQVVEKPGPTLFGREWLVPIQLNWVKSKALSLAINRRCHTAQSRSVVTEI